MTLSAYHARDQPLAFIFLCADSLIQNKPIQFLDYERKM